MYQIEKTTIIGEIVRNAPETMPLFRSIGMHCMGCAMANGETVEEACMVHGVNADEFVQAVNDFLANQD